MHTIRTGAAAILALALAAPAWAGSDRTCASVTGGMPVSSTSVRSNLQDLGYRVGKIEVEHGCYEVRAVNESGYEIKAIYHPATGDLVRAKLR